LGLSLGQNVVRTRVFGRTREAHNAVSETRAKTFIGDARAATSSFIAPAHFESGIGDLTRERSSDLNA